MPLRLIPVPLTRDAFAPFGDVIETPGAKSFPINAGMVERFHDLARVETTGDGHPLISIFRGQPYALPLTVRYVERHPLGSQAFFPVGGEARYAVIVAPPGDTVRPADLRAFIAAPGQGINYRPGVWHHVLLTLERPADFIVIDRGGPGNNCDEFHFEADVQPLFALT
ncbi:MAG TPA: ureidoglycolate lyase [Burkholderiales bacterium]|jgi:ureidoglycolate lyase